MFSYTACIWQKEIIAREKKKEAKEGKTCGLI
jgi:hypothetical protein